AADEQRLDPFHVPRDELLHQALVDDDPVGRHADLPGVHERAEDGGVSREVRAGIFQDDERVLPAELEYRGLEMLGGLDPDDAPDVGRAGEVHHPHARVGDQGSDHIAGVAQVVGDDVEDPAGSPASISTSASSSPQVIGASSLGFITTVLPTASGMAMDCVPRTSGAFHGEIAPTTPNGIRWAIEEAP